jgi:AraC-like DNA-binding protein
MLMPLNSLNSGLKVERISRYEAFTTEWHAHREGEVCSLTAGIMALETSAGALLMPQRRMGWIPPQYRHQARSYGPVAGWLVYLPPGLCGTLPKVPCVLESSELVAAIVQRLAAREEAAAQSAARDRLIAVLIDELRSEPESSISLPLPSDRRLVRIAHAILREPGCDKNLEQWARWGGLSARTLTREFKLETGLTFGRWRSLARTLRALEPLSRGVPVGEVALSVGYENTSAFIAVFKSLFGETPAARFRRGCTLRTEAGLAQFRYSMAAGS